MTACCSGLQSRPNGPIFCLQCRAGFRSLGPSSAGDLASKVHTHYRSIAPTPDCGPKKFVNWIREVSEMMESPLPVDED